MCLGKETFFCGQVLISFIYAYMLLLFTFFVLLSFKTSFFNQQINKCQVLTRMRRNRNPCALLVQPLWKTVWGFLKKLKMELPFDPAIPLLGIYPNKLETMIRKDICTPMFIAAQFTIAKIWKQPGCPSADEWIRKLVHLNNRILHCYKKEGILTICSSMDGPGEHYVK